MKVKSVAERECCQFEDLKPIEGTRALGRQYEFVFCIHCGRHLRLVSFTDAAGGSDWRYDRMVSPVEATTR